MARACKSILVVGSVPGSLINFRGPLLASLKAAGLTVHAAAPGLVDSSPVVHQLRSLGVIPYDIRIQRTGVNPVKDVMLLWQLYRLCKRLRPEYVLSYTAKPVVYTTLAAWFTKVPNRVAMITGLGYGFIEGAGNRRRLAQFFVSHLYKTALKRSTLVFFQNPDDEEMFRDNRLLPGHVPSFVLNGSGVDTDHFSPVRLPSSQMRFLLIARLLGDKGVREYVRAAISIRARYPDVVFALAGRLDSNPDSISQGELDTWISEGVLDFRGELTDVRPEIAKASVYVLPSYREGLPRTVLEAMAMGRPIITTNAPGCRETVIHGENGFLVRSKSVSGLVEAMENFLDKEDLVTSMGARSREIAVERYDVHKVNHAILKSMGIKR